MPPGFSIASSYQPLISSTMTCPMQKSYTLTITRLGSILQFLVGVGALITDVAFLSVNHGQIWSSVQLSFCRYVSQISRSITQRAVHHLPLVNVFRTKLHARTGPNTCSGTHSIRLRFSIFSAQRDLTVLWTLPMLIHMIFAI